MEMPRRRSQRVMIGVAVTVVSEATKTDPAFEESTQTLVVNAHGALITLPFKVEKGRQLLLKNRVTKEEQQCKVGHIGQEGGARIQVAVEFLTPSPNFWRIAFPPDDWAMSAPATPDLSKSKLPPPVSKPNKI